MIWRAATILILVALLTPFHILLRPTPLRGLVPKAFLRAVTRLIGIRVVTHGVRSRVPGTMTVANHVSWADIVVLGGVIDVAFVAKSEIRGWGPIGWLAILANTIFVERERRNRAGAQANAVADRLREGRPVIMFPEGGNSDGRVILPFKSTLFSAAEASGAPVQPVSLAFTRIGPMPVTRRALPLIAWVGETSIGAHAVRFMELRPVRCELLFHPPVRASDFPDRKALATHCHAAVDAGYRRLMRGRLEE